MRSYLSVSPNDEVGLRAAFESAANFVVLDLTPRRPDQRKHLVEAIKRGRDAGARLYVRLGPLGITPVNEDLDAAVAPGVDGIMLAFAEQGQDVTLLDAKIAVREAEQGLPHGALRIIAVTGASAVSIFEMGTFRRASRRLEGLAFEAVPLRRHLGSDRADDAVRLARTLTLLAARAAGVLAIDGQDEIDAKTAGDDGFDAKITANPTNVAAINAASPKT